MIFADIDIKPMTIGSLLQYQRDNCQLEKAGKSLSYLKISFEQNISRDSGVGII